MLADDGLVLEVDRFDPGKVSTQDNQILLPTATLPDDYIIPMTVVSYTSIILVTPLLSACHMYHILY